MYLYRGLRKKYQLPPSLFSGKGTLLFSKLAAIRNFLAELNRDRKASEHLYLGELRASALITESQQYVLQSYRSQLDKKHFASLLPYLEGMVGEKGLKGGMKGFVETYPPEEVFSGSLSAGQYIENQGSLGLESPLGLGDAILLCLANENPANKKVKALFDSRSLPDRAGFDQLLAAVEDYFRELPPLAPANKDLFSLLREPFRNHPGDLYAQLDYVVRHWKPWLPEDMIDRLLQGKDLMKEDYRPAGPGGGAPPTAVPLYGKKGRAGSMPVGRSGFDAVQASEGEHEEKEAFTPDTDWMPRVVLMAKNTYVWLHQLSKKYQRPIRRLDQVPDEELDQLVCWSFNGLWLIGLWERSTASQKIKHRMGNPEAIASAYALYDYQVAADLGGDEAYENLNRRAWQRGIRLASDMVPNHTGIYSRWIVDHPEYFIQSGESPFPGYRFSGPDLSDDPRVEICIEDGYYKQSDAAVVFRRTDRASGEVRFIYHGNDGTMMPWNDTAQLDMIKAEVREAVMEKIFEVASRFSIIRFDAAMTLAKKHFSRLWYPEPGSGGDIPSRSEHAMTKKTFDTLFPVEFWREVVDRINEKMPETLLLAEAFWFMEGYFVRSLGMHRVYNSAFMHMLKNEENEKYRDLITNTLEFEPEILKRYVNFMSNPDEETAIQQFGTGDKYFGICVLMNTLPGLPMFAHGQVEGYTEKYGMEYQRDYYHEEPQRWLVEKHEKEIFPLAAKRYLFSGVQHFNMYDFVDTGGLVNENVFAYTNSHGEEKALIVYNNSYGGAAGHIRESAPRRNTGGSKDVLVTANLADSLSMKPDSRYFYVAREHVSGLEYLIKGHDIHREGLHLGMRGFEYRVFLSFEEWQDQEGHLDALWHKLGGQPVADMRRALTRQALAPLHQSMMAVFEHETIQAFTEHSISRGPLEAKSQELLCERFRHFMALAGREAGGSHTEKEPCGQFTAWLNSISQCIRFFTSAGEWILPMLKNSPYQSAEELLVISSTNPYRENTILLLSSIVVQLLTQSQKDKKAKNQVMEKLHLEEPLEQILQQTGRGPNDIRKDYLLVQILSAWGEGLFAFHGAGRGRPRKAGKPGPLIIERQKEVSALLEDPLVQEYLGVNQYEGTWYYSKEQFAQLMRWLFSMACFSYYRSDVASNISKLHRAMRRSMELLLSLQELSGRSGYRLHSLREML